MISNNVFLLFNRASLLLAIVQMFFISTFYVLVSAFGENVNILLIQWYAIALTLISFTQLVRAVVLQRKEEEKERLLKVTTFVCYFITDFILIWAFVRIGVISSELETALPVNDQTKSVMMNLFVLQVTFLSSALTSFIALVLHLFVTNKADQMNYQGLSAI